MPVFGKIFFKKQEIPGLFDILNISVALGRAEKLWIGCQLSVYACQLVHKV